VIPSPDQYSISRPSNLVCGSGANVVLGKALGVLPKADVLKPIRYLLHRARRGFGSDQSPQDLVFILLTRGL
jgi:hypothetical protein